MKVRQDSAGVFLIRILLNLNRINFTEKYDNSYN